MSRDNLGNKQTIILHNCIINDDRYDLVITTHRQTMGYIRTTRQTPRKKIINKQKQFIRRRFSKRRNAVSESETSAIQELQNLKNSIKKTIELTIKYTFLTQKQRLEHQKKKSVDLKTHTQTNQ